MGYLMAFAMQYIGLCFVACVGLYILIFLSGSCWLLVALAHDINYDLHAIADVAKSKNQLYNEFSEFIPFHSRVIQLNVQNFYDVLNI